MSAEDINAPPVVIELAKGHPDLLGVAAQAYNFLWEMYVRKKNGDTRNAFVDWLSQEGHSWLEAEPAGGGVTPLIKLRQEIEAEKQEMLSRGQDPYYDIYYANP